MKNTRWTEIKYLCPCLTEERALHVEERRGSEDVTEFVTRCSAVIVEDHGRRSPRCRETRMTYVKIPVSDGVVGGATGGTA